MTETVTISPRHIKRIRQANAEMTKGISFSEEGLSRLPESSTQIRYELKRLASAALRHVQPAKI